MSTIFVNPNIPLLAVTGMTANIVLQPGAVILAEVQQILDGDQVQILIGGQSIVVGSQVSLQVGQTLQLAVAQAADGSIELALVNPGTAGQNAAGLANAGLIDDLVALSPEVTVDLAVPSALRVAAPNQLTPPQALAVAVAAQAAATRQTGLAPLFADLGVATGVNGLPQPVQRAMVQVLAQRLSLDPGLSGADIKQAFQSSGLFLEASLAAGTVTSPAAPDLKAALIVLRQVLTTSLAAGSPPSVDAAPTTNMATTSKAEPALAPNDASRAAAPMASSGAIAAAPDTPTMASPTLAPSILPGTERPQLAAQGAASPQGPPELDATNPVIAPPATDAATAARAALSNAALNLLQETVQAGHASLLNAPGLQPEAFPMPPTPSAWVGIRPADIDDGVFARTNVPPPPIGGAVPAAQPVLPPTLAAHASPETAMQHLLADTDGALARQTLLQAASLPDRVDTASLRVDPNAVRWAFEIPFVTAQGTAMAQFEISRDGSGSEVESAKRIWRARFALDIEPAGPVHALISLSGERTSVRMWAERPATAAQLRAGIPELSQALSRAELRPGDIMIGAGAPAQTASASAGHFLDRAS